MENTSCPQAGKSTTRALNTPEFRRTFWKTILEQPLTIDRLQLAEATRLFRNAAAIDFITLLRHAVACDAFEAFEWLLSLHHPSTDLAACIGTQLFCDATSLEHSISRESFFQALVTHEKPVKWLGVLRRSLRHFRDSSSFPVKSIANADCFFGLELLAATSQRFSSVPTTTVCEIVEIFEPFLHPRVIESFVTRSLNRLRRNSVAASCFTSLQEYGRSIRAQTESQNQQQSEELKRFLQLLVFELPKVLPDSKLRYLKSLFAESDVSAELQCFIGLCYFGIAVFKVDLYEHAETALIQTLIGEPTTVLFTVAELLAATESLEPEAAVYRYICKNSVPKKLWIDCFLNQSLRQSCKLGVNVPTEALGSFLRSSTTPPRQLRSSQKF